MRVLILGNMANDGYSVAKAMRKLGISADLGINISDFGMALPEWEDASADGLNPYDLIHGKFDWQPPDWIVYFDFKNRNRLQDAFLEKIKARIDLWNLSCKYDVVEAGQPYSLYSQFLGKPYCVYDAGWIRYLPAGRGIRMRLARRAYSKANRVMFTNPDTLRIFESVSWIKIGRLRFTPFAIDPEKYRTFSASEVYELRKNDPADIRLFSPARQIWREKGNDLLIHAFGEFSRIYHHARMTLVDWGPDAERSMAYAKDLGVAGKIDWIKPVTKNRLIQLYNAADVVLDQFVLGSWGTAAPEAMSCGRPLLMFIDEIYVGRCFASLPPLLNCRTSTDILNNLTLLVEDDGFRRSYGKRLREWVIRTHHPEAVARTHCAVLEEALAG